MLSKSQAILSSHRDAATRVSDLFRTKHHLELNPSDSLDVVATVLGAANWKTLSAMAKQGRVPRMVDLEPGPAGTSFAYQEHAEQDAITSGSLAAAYQNELRPTRVKSMPFIVENELFRSSKSTGK